MLFSSFGRSYWIFRTVRKKVLYLGQAEINVSSVCCSDTEEETIPAKKSVWLVVAAPGGKTEEDCPEPMWL